MKHLAHISLLLLLMLATGAFSQEAGNSSGTLTISSDPAGCWVRIDSVLVGQTPLAEFELESGQHQIRVFPPEGGSWNRQERHYSIKIPANQHQILNVVFSEPVYINTIPFGARVYADTMLLGQTPLYVPREKYRQLTIEKPGFQPYQLDLRNTVALSDGSPPIITLVEDPSFTEEDYGKPILLGLSRKSHQKSKLGLLTLTVVSQWASFYFKNRADSHYEKYLETADTRSAQSSFDKTRRFDRMSSISLGVSYASLAGLIYFVVWK